MKSTGIVRKVDELGRIVLPIELRRTLDIAEKDSMEIYIEGDTIILRSISLPASSVTMRATLSLTAARTSAPTASACLRRRSEHNTTEKIEKQDAGVSALLCFLYPISFVLPKETGIPPKKSAFCLVRCNLTLAETLYVVIPKQDT